MLPTYVHVKHYKLYVYVCYMHKSPLPLLTSQLQEMRSLYCYFAYMIIDFLAPEFYRVGYACNVNRRIDFARLSVLY